jgi:WD40-like Beta Propeller Repeat
MALSADDTRIVRSNTAGPSRDIWIEHLTTGVSTRLGPSNAIYAPIWSHDGQWAVIPRGIPFSNIYRRATDGTDLEERLTNADRNQAPTSVSPDGASLLYSEFDPVSGPDIWVLPLSSSVSGNRSTAAAAPLSTPRPFIKSNFAENAAVFSPDGEWVVYQSNESGRFEIYVRPYPEGIRKFQVSVEGGIEATWSPTGREIFYRGTGNMMMTAALDTASDFRSEKPRPLFDARDYENAYGVSRDGKRLLMMRLIRNEAAANEVHLVTNLLAELRQRVK